MKPLFIDHPAAKPKWRLAFLCLSSVTVCALTWVLYLLFHGADSELSTDDLFSPEARAAFTSKFATPKASTKTGFDAYGAMYQSQFYKRQLVRAFSRRGIEKVRLSQLRPLELEAIKKIIENIHAKDENKVDVDSILVPSTTIRIQKDPSGFFTLDCRLPSGSGYTLMVHDED